MVGSFTVEPGAEPFGLNCARSADVGGPDGDQLPEELTLVPLLFQVKVAAEAELALPATIKNTQIVGSDKRNRMWIGLRRRTTN